MNQENEALLNDGVSAVRSGNKREGARILAQVVRAEPQSDEAWFWLAAATDQPGEAKACLDRVLKLNPNHARARQALDLINQGGGAMPPTAAFTGEGGGGSSYGMPAPPVRPLSTGELISPAGGFGGSPYGAAPPPPPASPYGAPPSPYNSGAATNFPPPPFGTPPPPASNAPSPYGSPMMSNPTEPSVPPPPFGAPAWAAQGQSADPYGSPAGISSAPPPPFAGGMRFGQLDPAAAAAQQSQAVLEEPVGPKIYDPGAEIRRSLLGDPPMPPPGIGQNPQNGAAVPPPINTAPKKKRNNRGLLLILLAVAVLIMAAVFALSASRGTTTTVATTPEVGATATTTEGVGTPGVSATVGGADTTSAAVTTQSNATTAAVATPTSIPNVVTTAPANTTAAATTAAAPATSAAPRPPTATSVVVVPPGGTARPTQTQPAGSAVTIVPPNRSPTVPAGSTIPPQVQQYVNDANNIINQMAFVESQINTLIVQPYRDGKIKPGAAIAKSYEISFFTLLTGQLAAQFRQLNPPPEAFQLSQVGLDYASDIREIGVNIDRFFDTGRITYLEEVSNLSTKAAADRSKWFQTIQAGYPFKVTF